MSVYSKIVAATLDNGIEPLVFDFEVISSFNSENEIVRSFITVNSMELGVLAPSQYRFVARRTAVGEKFIERHVHKLFMALPELMQEFPHAECFTIPVFPRLLKSRLITNIIYNEYMKAPPFPLDKICVEISSDILYEELDGIKEELHNLKALGVKIAVCEVGDPFCPVLRLKKLPFDMAFLDAEALKLGEDEDDKVLSESLVNLLRSINLTPYACSLPDEDKIGLANDIGCEGYSIKHEIPKGSFASGEVV